MNLIDEQLENLKKEKRLGLMTHLVIGYPSLEMTQSLVKLMVNSGVDFIELQIPFSDPLADGPTIMKACEKSLQQGTKVKDAFALANKLSKQIKIPLIFMAYYNTVFKYATKRFCEDAKRTGISGLIIPDIPLEEEHEENFIKYCNEAGLKNIRVVSPASTVERLSKNSKVANGFVYVTSRQGITGVRNTLDPEISKFLQIVRQQFFIPLAVGFGISKKIHLEKLSSHADIAVVGSAIIDLINKSKESEIKTNIERFISNLRL